MGSKTPITHALSGFILSVIGRHISDLPKSVAWWSSLRTIGRPPPWRGRRCVYRPRWLPEGDCFGGHTAAPHHLSGPPPRATAVLEIGATVAVPIVSAATASTIASDVFMSALLSDRR